jgi:TRAP transporter TAXI family solute receptor
MRSQFSTTSRVWRHSRVIASCGIFLALALQACTVVQHRPDVVIGTGRPGGVYFPLGDSVCRVFNLDLPRHGLRCAASLSRAPVANIESLRDRRIDIGVVQSDVLADAIRGEGPFVSRAPDAALRVLFTGQTEAFTIVARRELEIRRATELRGKRINLGSPGSGERVSMERIMGRSASRPQILPQLASCLSPSNTTPCVRTSSTQLSTRCGIQTVSSTTWSAAVAVFWLT